MRTLAALSWEPQVKGALYVVLAITILCGSCYLLLATNMGARLGFLLAGAGLFGWLATLGFVWWAYARGPVGPEPSWKPQGVVVGDVAASGRTALKGFPQHWKKLPLTDKEVTDATPVTGPLLAPQGGKGPFKSASDYVVVAAYRKGGDSHGILGLNFRPLNLWHSPHYLVVQAQKSMQQTNPEGGPAKSVADPSAEPVSVLMLRDLGAKRLHPAVFALASATVFGLFCYQLHVRDREAAARRESEGLQPVLR